MYVRTKKSKVDEVRDILANVVLAHIPVVAFDFRNKALHLCFMVRRLLMGNLDPSQLDDKV